MKKIILIALFFTFLFGRDNPFLPVKVYEPFMDKSAIKPFTSHQFSFPKNAKIIDKISIDYINVDGSVQTMVLDINESINWHDIFILQTKSNNFHQKIQDSNNNTDKKNIINSKNIKDSKIKAQNNTPINIPTQNTQINNVKNENDDIQNEVFTKNLFDIAQIEYSLMELNLKSDYKLLRYFTLPSPQRIVFDFQSDKVVKAQTIKLDNSYFDKVVVGYHDNFVRLVFYTDALYEIKIDTKPDKVRVLLH